VPEKAHGSVCFSAFSVVLLQIQTWFEALFSALEEKEEAESPGNCTCSVQVLVNMLQEDQNYEE